MPWSPKEKDLLLRLRMDENRPWSEVTRSFSDSSQAGVKAPFKYFGVRASKAEHIKMAFFGVTKFDL
jgi:hypothetical protein